MNQPLLMDADAPLAEAQRLTLCADLVALLDEVRYDGLLPGTGQMRAESDLLADALPLSRALVLERLHDMAEGLDCRAERAAYESLPEWPGQAESQDLAHDAAPEAEAPAELEAAPEPAGDPETHAGAGEESAAPIAVLPESLDGFDGETEPPSAVEAPPSQAPDAQAAQNGLFEDEVRDTAEAEVPTDPHCPQAEALDPFELAQTVTAQLMERLDEQLSSQYPPAVYDSFAEMYFQFSTKLCERLSEQDPQQLLRLMSQEAAR